ncbi:MAG: peptide-binding protein [Candidatus Omnitrophica bacterium CG11_big_fil_rev_8_21_14_0_20_64_10]|nr:MAG: peptide-binding protein [Candidatus Omnitrophica bacterium CG11_big_fil_rev_8_21_14_0_20_64_10]
MSRPPRSGFRSLRPLFLPPLLLLLSSAGPVSAGTAPIGGPIPGDLLVTALIGEPATLVPVLAADSPSHEICALVFNGLVRYGRGLMLEGDLAQRWEIEEEGRLIRFYLKRGVLWQDGAPFTAEDVLFTYRQYVNPNVPSPYGGDFKSVTSVTAPDPYTVEVRYAEPFAPALDSWAKWIMPKHLLEGQDLLTTPFKSRPVGTGPFRLKEWRRGQRITLTANPTHHAGRPYLNGIVFRIIPDQSTIFLELQAGGIDSGSLTPLQYARMTGTRHFEAAFRKYHYPSLGYTYLGTNLRDPRFADHRVRQAINLAIDKQEIIDGVLFGLGEISTGPFPKKSWAFDPEVQPAAFDPKRAGELLTEAGWIDGDGDGIREKDGRPFRFTILTNQGNLARKLAAQIIVRRLREVGISAKIRFLEWATFIDEYINKRRFEAVVLGWGLSWDPDPYDIWHSSKQGPGEFNFIGYANPEADRLIEAGRREMNREKRAEIYRRLHRLLYNDQPVCFLYVADGLPVLSRRFRDIELSPFGGISELLQWYVPETEQKYRWVP